MDETLGEKQVAEAACADVRDAPPVAGHVDPVLQREAGHPASRARPSLPEKEGGGPSRQRHRSQRQAGGVYRPRLLYRYL